MKRIQSGFTMIEVLVAAIILMASLLGMGALQSTTMNKTNSAMNKTQATEAMNYIANALRSQWSTNPSQDTGVDAAYNDFVADFASGSNYQNNFVDDCGSGCSRQQMTDHMLASWERMIGENLPQGKGTIVQQTKNLDVDGDSVSTTYYEITIMWDDRQMAQQASGEMATLGTNCSGNPKVDLACLRAIVRP
ncbi:type IV pilus modification protein PilV [Litoribrevibacter euphylliae]|uniref:Type IV pilus modification protein PilV n=1 Tax=Litoribrevibacter euphylliae TaxID=1834034 RepID=A0ABV7HE54_9GAMM